MNQADSEWGGPYLQAAFFCERLLQEADGVVSAIRIVDHITSQTSGQNAPAPLSAVSINLTFVILLKTGRARGHRELTVVMEPPFGPSPVWPNQHHTQTILLEGPDDRGDTIVMPVSLNVSPQGVYWFGVFLDDRLMTRVPLRVELQGQTQESNPR